MIEKIQHENAKFEELLTGYDSIVLELKKQLKVVPHYFIHFSRHDQSHSEQIMQYIERLIGEENLKLLSTSDKMMIALACYAHDVGMALNHQQIDDLFSKADFSEILQNSMDTSYADVKDIVDKILSFPDSYKDSKDAYQLYVDVGIVIENVFRRDHAKRSSDYILKSESINNILGARCTKHLAAICKMHDQDASDIMGMPYRENGLFDDYFHPRFIASLLCLGDLMDMDTDRFDMDILKASSGMPMLSELHKKKHESVTSYLVETSRIEIGANCESVQVYRIMRQWMDWMKNVTDFMLRNWDEITPDKAILPPRIKKCDILINNNAKWIGYANTKIKVDAKKAAKLLQGSNIYDGKHIFVRELIQNAMDASLIQLYLDCEQKNGGSVDLEAVVAMIEDGKINIHDYDIDGRIYIDDDKAKFELIDHGTGIASSEIPVMAGLQGKSKRLKDIIKKMPEALRPSGAFGIGLQSAFQVAEKIEFYTKTCDEEAKVITIDDPGTTGYVYVEDYASKMPRGTRIVVTLDENKLTQTDLNVPDYEYNMRDHRELVCEWLSNKCENIRNSGIMVVQAQNQTIDYFNLSVFGRLKNENIDQEILHRTSLFDQNLSSLILRDYEMSIATSSLRYKRFDEDNNCLFEAIIPLTDWQAGEDDSGKVIFGAVDRSYMEYMQSIWYRNAYVEMAYAVKSEHIFLDFLDYRINIFSDASDDVLTLDRHSIRGTYSEKLYSIISSEIMKMCRNLIDCYLSTDSDLANCKMEHVGYFYLYYMALYANYRIDELEKKNSKLLSEIEIGDFWKTEKEEVYIPLKDIKDKDIYFYTELNPEYNKISAETWKKVSIPVADLSSLCVFNVHESRAHYIDFGCEAEFLSEVNGERIHVFKVNALVGEKKKTGVYISDVVKYLDLLDVIFMEQRCIKVLKGYEDLATPLVQGIKAHGFINPLLMIEMKMDEGIVDQIKQELELTKRISSADNYVRMISESDRFSKNIDFIAGYHPTHKRSEIEDKYKKLLKEFLSLLERDEYAEIFDLVYPELSKKLPFMLDKDEYMGEKYRKYTISRYNCELV